MKNEKAQGPADDTSFRDTVSTISKKGKRVWVYPKLMQGRMKTVRNLIAFFFLACLAIGPFLHIHGHPMFLFNVVERRFIVFGVGFFPQDFFLLALCLLTFIVFIILFTALFGRIFCGYACPQTIFMEFIFRKIEYLIEGDANERRRLDEGPWNARKIRKKVFKVTLFYLISFGIANIFLAYIIGIDELWNIMKEPLSSHLPGFIAMLVFSFVFFFVFAYMREQVCLVVCPYGRLQGVLLDKDSIVVAYHDKRGEPRGKPAKDSTAVQGDCVDCKLCVNVCPTGIDIRNGTQLECINCAACIDACDSIMHRLNRPDKLIGYYSLNNIRQGLKFRITSRIVAYSIVFTLLASVVSFLLITRRDVQTTVLRSPGMLYQQISADTVSNLYNINMVNKTFHDLDVTLQLVSPAGSIQTIGGRLQVKSGEPRDGVFMIKMNVHDIKQNKTPVVVDVMQGKHILQQLKTTFIGPVNLVKHRHDHDSTRTDTLPKH